jgi:ABC-2 type transport system permease protein
MKAAALLRVLIKENLSLKRLFGFDPRESKGKAIGIAIAIIYGLGAILFSTGFMFFDLGATLAGVGQTSILLNFVYVYVFGFTALLTLMRANAYLFQYRDYSILGPLPIKATTVMTAKLLVMMLFIEIPNFIIVLPIAVSYFWFAGVTFLGIVFFLLGFLLVSLLPIVLVSFISFLIARVTARMRHKNIVSLIFMIAITVGYLVYSFTSLDQTSANPLLAQTDLMNQLSAFLWPLAWFVNGIHSQSGLDFLFLLLSHAAIFALFLLLLSKLAIKTNQLGQVVVTKKKKGNGTKPDYQVVKQKVFKTLVIKEWRKFIASPMYAMNSGIGLVMMLIFAVISLFYQNAIGEFMPMLAVEGFSGTLAIIVFVGFCAVMVYTPAISLSLEGKNFWIIKSLPIKAATVMTAKIGFNLLISVPITLVASTLLGIAFQIPWYDVAALLLWGVSILILSSTVDAAINLLFPKMVFNNEMEVVKQSLAALIAIFGGFALIAINGFGYYFLTQILDSVVALSALVLFNGGIGLWLFGWIKRKSAFYFNRL